MGFPYHELVPAAILLSNPNGLTKREYLEALKRVKVSPTTVFKKEDPLDSYSNNDVEANCFSGSKGLAHALRLEESFEFQIFQTPSMDSAGLVLCPPTFIPLDVLDYSAKTHKRELVSAVAVHLDNTVREAILETTESETIERQAFEIERDLFWKLQDLPISDRSLEIPFEVEGKVVFARFEVKIYSSEDSLYRDFPQFDADRRYDFNQREGNFYVSRGSENFLWFFEKGKYFLDTETFDRIPASWRSSRWKSFGFSDLVLTSLAVENEAWKLLSRRGLDHMGDFLEAFPKARERYEEAVRDSQTFIYGKENKETAVDIMWRRNNPPGFGKERDI